MIHEINLPYSSIKLIPLKSANCQSTIPVAGQHNLTLDDGCCNRFAVVVKGFVHPLVLEISETAVAQLHDDAFDIDVSLGLSNLISHAVAAAEAVIGARKNVRVHDLALASDDMRVAAEKSVRGESHAVTGDALLSFAYSIDVDDELIGTCVAESELGSIQLMRLRLLDDDALYMMTDDMDLKLSEIYRFEETG